MLGREVDRHEWAGLECSGRCDIENFPTLSRDHILPEEIGELSESSDIEVDHISLLDEIRLMEVSIITESGIVDEDFYIYIFRDKHIVDSFG